MLNPAAPYYSTAEWQEYVAQGFWQDETIAQFLVRTATSFAEQPAARGITANLQPVSLTYGQLHAYGVQIAQQLQAAGVTPGDAVILRIPNLIEFAGALYGSWYAGAIPVFALPAHGERELKHFVRSLAAAGHKPHLATVAQFPLLTPLAAQELGEVPCHYILPPDPSFTAPMTVPSLAGTNAFGLALYQCSGGTTGIPKLIPRTHAAYLYSVRESARICQLTNQDVLLQVLPAAHNFSLSSPGILGMIAVGGKVVYHPDPTPASAFAAIKQQQVTLTALVPPLLQSWLASPNLDAKQLASLRLLLVGGAKLQPEIARRVEPALDCVLMQVFGMAEGLVNYTRLTDSAELKEQTQGRPLSSADQIRVLDDLGQPVAPGSPGNLWTKGPYTIHGYLGGVDQGSFSEDGFYCTGDIVQQLASGHLVVTGRAKDQINRAGEKISPAVVENVLLSLPAVTDAIVIGLPDPLLGEAVCAVIVTTDQAACALASCREAVRQAGLADFNQPDRVVYLDTLPQTGVGKISRKELRRLLQTQLTGGLD